MTNAIILASYQDVENAAKAMAASHYFQDAQQAAQAVVKILAGQEMGFGPFASMTGVYIIQGRPSIGANLMAAAVKKSGRYNYRLIEMTDTACEIEYTENGQPCGRSRFTLEDAKRAGTKNLDKFPRNMLFARAMSNGVRWFCPDVFAGAPVYTPEELGANVNESGEVIDLPVEEVKAIQPAPVQVPPLTSSAASITYEDACKVKNRNGEDYGSILTETLVFMLNSIEKAMKKDATPEERAEHEYKRDAILVILNHRKEGN